MRLYFSMNMTENKKTNGFAPLLSEKIVPLSAEKVNHTHIRSRHEKIVFLPVDPYLLRPCCRREERQPAYLTAHRRAGRASV